MKIPDITQHTDDKQFVACLPLELELEGGNDDDPHDPGGRTSRGIIQREYDIYRKRKGLPTRDVWTASWDEIFDIYFVSYWQPWCPQLWAGVNQQYFDQAINQGPVQAGRNLQRALNAFHDPGWTAAILRSVNLKSSLLAVDGHVGPATLAALDAIKDKHAFIRSYYDWDMSFYRQLRNWYRYGRGWTSRAQTVLQRALALAAQPISSVPPSKTNGG